MEIKIKTKIKIKLKLSENVLQREKDDLERVQCRQPLPHQTPILDCE